MDFEVISGGLLLPKTPAHITKIAAVIEYNYRQVEEVTGMRFGKDFLWHVQNPELSDWYPNSITPAMALAILKEYNPLDQVGFATDLSRALFAEGRDLTDREAYRHLLSRYNIPEVEFFKKLQLPEYADEAQQDFATVRKLGISGYPSVLLQTSESRFVHVCNGYMPYDQVEANIINASTQ